MKYYDKNQINQGEVLVNYCYMTFALITLRSKDLIVILIYNKYEYESDNKNLEER